MQQGHSTSEIVRTWWHPGLENELSEFDDATTPPAHHTMVLRDERDLDGLGLNLELDFQSAKCAAVMPLETLYRSVRDSYQNGSGRCVDKTRTQRERPLSAPALLPSTTLNPLASLPQPQRESSEYSFADNITDIIETMLDHVLTIESSIPKGLSGKPLQVEDVLVAVTRGEYSTDTVQEAYLPNRLKIPLRLPLKAITEEQEDTSPLHKKQQSTIMEETSAFIAELEDTSRINNRESGSSTLSSDPMGMFNYEYLEPADWYDSQPLLIRPNKNAGTVSLASSPPITPLRSPINHSVIPPYSPPNKPLPALPPGASSPTKQTGNAMASTMTVSRFAPLQVLHTKLYHESLKSESERSENFRSKPLFPSNHTVLEPGFIYDPNSKQELQENPEAHIHPLFRKGAQISAENPLSSSPTKQKPLSSSVWSGTNHHRGLSDVSDRSMMSPSLPHSKPPSFYLYSPPVSPKAPSVTESDPFTSSNNELNPSPLRLSNLSADSAFQARIALKKSASLGKGTSLKKHNSLDRSASFATRASLKSGVLIDRDDDSCSDLISFDKSVSPGRSTPFEKRISTDKQVSLKTRPSRGKRASLEKRASVDNYGSLAERIALNMRPSLERPTSLDSTLSGASVRRSISMRTTGADAPFILHNSRLERRLSIDCIKEYAEAMDDIHGLERVKPLDAINENFIDIPKEQFRILPNGLTSPSVSQLSLKNIADKPWPMKKKSSTLRRVSDGVTSARIESFSTVSSGATRSDTVTCSASLTVPTIEELDILDSDDPFAETVGVEPSTRKRSGRVKELLALKAEEEKQAAATQQLKELREKEGKMAKFMRRAQSFERVGEGFKKFFSGMKKDEAKMAEAGYR